MSTENLWKEAAVLPDSFDEKKTLMETLLKRALKSLLDAARTQDILTVPYGRPEQPTPLLSLETFLKHGGLAEPTDGSVNDDPVFLYEYGFDPLHYVAEYLKFLHPDSIQRMRGVRADAIDFLRLRAGHAQTQLDCMDALQQLTRRLRSGVLWGPLVAPSTLPSAAPGSLVCACQTVKAGGDLVVEVSSDPTFATVDRAWTVAVQDATQVQKITLTNLEPSQTYYLRCHVRPAEVVEEQSGGGPVGEAGAADVAPPPAAEGGGEESAGGDGSTAAPAEAPPRPQEYQTCQFTVGPSDEDDAADPSPRPVQVVAVNARSAHLVSAPTDGPATVLTCLLGEVFPRTWSPTSSSSSSSADAGVADSDDDPTASDAAHYRRLIFHLHRYSHAFSSPSVLLRRSLMLLAWHDRTPGSDVLVGEEEAAIKRFVSDYGKYQKKYGGKSGAKAAAAAKNKRGLTGGDKGGANGNATPPAPKLQRPELSVAVTALLQGLPLEMEVGTAAAATGSGEDAGGAASAARISTAMRQLYSTQMLGPKVQVVVLDHRRGYLGKEQVAWLTDTLKTSPAPWKIILTGAPCGAHMTTIASPTEAATDEDVADAFGAADEAAGETKGGDEVEDVVAPFEASDSAGAGGPTVKMSLPPPLEAGGHDEAGRYKLSLAGVIAELQKAAIAEKQKNAPEQASEAAAENVAAVEDGRSSVYIESGIVILSSGACVPEDRAGALAGLPVAADAPHFAALYDPQACGTAFCMELCVGGGEPFSAADLKLPPSMQHVASRPDDTPMPDSHRSAIDDAGSAGLPTSLQPVLLPSLGAQLLFGLDAADNDASLAAAATLNSDGSSLELKLMRVDGNGAPSAPFFTCTLRCNASP
jgi:hypothetical protein